MLGAHKRKEIHPIHHIPIIHYSIDDDLACDLLLPVVIVFVHKNSLVASTFSSCVTNTNQSMILDPGSGATWVHLTFSRQGERMKRATNGKTTTPSAITELVCVCVTPPP